MKKNNRGAIMLVGLIGLGLIGLMATTATIETAKNGVLKKNGQLIWCKMQNKGNVSCDLQYQ